MAYNDDALKARLSTLNETQDSIVSVSSWITFHRRHADRIASYWLTRLRDAPPPKRLNFIYLVNDIVQNARARKRPEFPDAFSPLMPEAMATAYRSSTPDIQSKIRRVIEVWRNRAVFEAGIQAAIDARLDEIDKTKSSSGKKTLGGSLFGSSSGGLAGGSGNGGVPSELAALPPLQIAVTKAALSSGPSVTAAQSEHAKLTRPDSDLPPPPVHAARLSSLIKTLATAESGVTASIKARQSLIAELEKLLDTNKKTLAEDEAGLADLTSKRDETEAKKRDVEDAIMRGLAAGDEDQHRNQEGSGGQEYRPEVEELTPEPDEFDPTVVGTTTVDEYVPPSGNLQFSSNPRLQGLLAGFNAGGDDDSAATIKTPPIPIPTPPANTASPSRVRQASSEQGMNGYSAKRRKISHGGDNDQAFVPDLGEMGMGEDEFGINSTPLTGLNEPSVHQAVTGNQTGLISPGIGEPGEAVVHGYSGGGGISAEAEGEGDILGNLDADVDELIRREGA